MKCSAYLKTLAATAVLALLPWGQAGAAVPIGTGALAEQPPVKIGDSTGVEILGAAWGFNNSGQIGDGTKVSRLTPVLTNGGFLLDSAVMTSIDPGESSACGISLGRVYCWGNNTFGQLGNNSQTFSPVPVLVSGVLAARTVTAVSVGKNHACAVADGAVYCWGGNGIGQLGLNQAYPAKELVPTAVYAGGVLAGKTVSAVSAGDAHTCVIASAKVYCWGADESGQLGTKAVEKYEDEFVSLKPVAVDAGTLKDQSVTTIAAGEAHTCAVAAGRAYCWGANDRGQLGTGTPDDQASPATVFSNNVLKDLTVTAMSAGGNDTCVLAGKKAVRHAYCWGENNGWQLGNGGQLDKSSIPVTVHVEGSLADKSVSAISVGKSGGCFVIVGAGYCWGGNSNGRIGNNTTTSSKVPAAVNTGGVLSQRTLLTISAGNGGSTTARIATRHTFSDVPPDHQFADDIGWLSATGITTGYPDGTYKPGSSTQRQAMAAFLFRFENPGKKKPECTGPQRIFGDVGIANDFCGEIEWLAKAKIVDVTPKFSPGDPMLRGDMAVWLYHAQHPDVPVLHCAGTKKFTDVPIGADLCGSIEWLANTGVTTGNEDGTFAPKDPVSRQAMSAFMHRVSELAAH